MAPILANRKTKMSDAKQQSVTKCKHRHNWIDRWIDERALPVQANREIVCATCGHKPNDKEQAEADAVIHLKKILKPGDTVYTVLRSVSRSGMSRNIDLYFISDNVPMWISTYVGYAIGSPQSYKSWERSLGLTVQGCGMDMGFHLVYSLGRVLWPEGFKVNGRGRNGDTSGWDRDGGYALNHKWL